MAVIRPFFSIRPSEEKADKIAALPYDVYNREEAKAAVANHPLSFLNIDRAETQFDDTVDTYDERVYQKAHDLLWDMVEKGDFIREKKRCYYIYELTMDGRTQTGITACASIDDYANGVIKKHENTRAEKEADRIRHVDVCSAQTGPIFLAYRAKDEIRALVQNVKSTQPEFSFTSEDGIHHAGWKIEEPELVKKIHTAFQQVDSIYIADGHHRAASAVKVGLKRRVEHPDYDGTEEFNYFLSVLFPEEELMIMDYNRVVKDLNGLSETEFITKVSEKFEIQKLGEMTKPVKKGQVTMYLHGSWYGLTAKSAYIHPDPVEGLDVSFLQRELLTPVLGIGDPRTDKRIDFIGGIRGLEELKRRADSDMEVAFAMYPTSIQELFAVADADLLMPPKSTWFEPKLRSGLFIHQIER